MKNRIVPVAVLVGAVIVLVTFLGAARMSGDDASKTAKDAPKILSPVKTGSKGVVVFGPIDVDNGVGLNQLYPETFPQPSKVKKILIAEGQTVVKGQPLLELDSEFADLTVAEAKAGLAQANAARQQAEAGIHMAEQALAAQQVQIKSTQEALNGKAIELETANDEYAEQERKLKGFGAQGDPELRIAKKKIDSASKALASEKIRLGGLTEILPTPQKEKAEGALAEANAAIARQQAVLDKALYAQKLSVMTAPADGKIVRSMVSEGMTFGPQTRQPAFLFQPKGALIVRAEVDQEFASRVAVGQSAIIQDDGNSSLKWTGKVLRISEGFLPKRTGSTGPEGLLVNDARVLECIVGIEGVDPNAPVRVGQRVKVSIGVE